MNIGLLIRGAKAGAKLAGKAAKATGRGAKIAAKATGAKAKGAAKAVGNTKIARGAKRVGGKVVENVGYAATPGLRRAVVAGAGKGSTRYFKKAAGTGAIKSIAKAQVKRTGKKVVGGAAAIGTGYGTTKTVKSRRAAAAKAKAAREAAAAKGRAAVTKPKPAPAKPAPKPAPKSKVVASKPKVVAPKPKAAPAKKRVSRFDGMSKKKLKSLTGKNKLMYRRYLREGGKNKV